MKISECSQGREFQASWKFWGKICLWIWSDSNNNSQDHCETFWKGIVDFFFPPRKASAWLKYHCSRRQAACQSPLVTALGGQQARAVLYRQEQCQGTDGHLCPCQQQQPNQEPVATHRSSLLTEGQSCSLSCQPKAFRWHVPVSPY